MVKGSKIALEHYYSSCCPDEVFRQIYKGYREACQSRRKLDFDDMILYCYELFVQEKRYSGSMAEEISVYSGG